MKFLLVLSKAKYLKYRYVILFSDGDNLDRFDIVLTNKKLVIKFEGIISYRTIINLKEKIKYIIDEYEISEVIIDIDDCLNIDDKALMDFINEYSRKGIDDLSVVGLY